MGGNEAGNKKGAATKLKRNPNYFKEIGALGGMSHNRGGFASLNKGKDGLTGPERLQKILNGRKKKHGWN